MNLSETKKRLLHHSRDTGIPKAELQRMCLKAGLDLLEKGELKVKRKEAK